MATGICNWFTIRQRNYVLRFHDANLSSQLWIDPTFREKELEFFRDYLKPGDRVIDVGANIGDTVLTASLQVGPTGEVLAIEAHPRTFGFLRQNIELNNAANVTLINSAVGAEPGRIFFSDDRRDDMNRVQGDRGLEMAIRPLDTIVQGRRPVALLKIDVEGYEKFVLEGASEILAVTECVYFEVSAAHFDRFGYTTRDLLELLLSQDFKIFRISRSNELTAILRCFDTNGYENLVAVRSVSSFASRSHWIVHETQCSTAAE